MADHLIVDTDFGGLVTACCPTGVGGNDLVAPLLKAAHAARHVLEIRLALVAHQHVHRPGIDGPISPPLTVTVPPHTLADGPPTR